jgi:hypothetical protein
MADELWGIGVSKAQVPVTTKALDADAGSRHGER